MAYPAKVIANYFIKKAREQNDDSLNLMKLLKLIYIAHGWSLALLNKPLVDENIEAWRYGPVIKAVYNSLKHNGMKPINIPICDPDVNEKGDIFNNNFDIPLDPDTSLLLDLVINTHKANSGIQLSNWSHDKDGPWYKVWKEDGGGYSSPVIPSHEIKIYFEKQGMQNESSDSGSKGFERNQGGDKGGDEMTLEEIYKNYPALYDMTREEIEQLAIDNINGDEELYFACTEVLEAIEKAI